MVFGQMNEPPGARMRVALTGLTIAEYFRDVEGQDVLLFIDNIFRFTQAGSEVSALWDGCRQPLVTNQHLRQNGTVTRTDYLNQERFCYIDPGHLRASR